MFKCNLCHKEFETERSLNSHRAWHSGKLKAWKDASLLEYPVSKTKWRRKGTRLIREFLRKLLNPDMPVEDREDLIKMIHMEIEKHL